jgi:hypothetical protein
MMGERGLGAVDLEHSTRARSFALELSNNSQAHVITECIENLGQGQLSSGGLLGQNNTNSSAPSNGGRESEHQADGLVNMPSYSQGRVVLSGHRWTGNPATCALKRVFALLRTL